jgi:hypothetical protein
VQRNTLTSRRWASLRCERGAAVLNRTCYRMTHVHRPTRTYRRGVHTPGPRFLTPTGQRVARSVGPTLQGPRPVDRLRPSLAANRNDRASRCSHSLVCFRSCTGHPVDHQPDGAAINLRADLLDAASWHPVRHGVILACDRPMANAPRRSRSRPVCRDRSYASMGRTDLCSAEHTRDCPDFN